MEGGHLFECPGDIFILFEALLVVIFMFVTHDAMFLFGFHLQIYIKIYQTHNLSLLGMNRISQLIRFTISKEREKLYLLSHRISDIVKIRDIDNDPYVIIDGQRIDFPRTTYIGNVKVPTVSSFLKFYDMRFNYFYNSTAVSRVLNQSFFLQIQQELYFVINHDPLTKLPQSPLFEVTEANATLQPIVCETLKQLQSMDSISRVALINMLMKNVMDRSFELKQEQLMFRQFLKIVEKKITDIELDIRAVENKLGERAKRRVRWFTNFIIAEIALLHYFIYFNLSWDVMEPVTVILANLDLMAGYWFFIWRGTPFSPKNWQNLILQKRKNKQLTKHGIDVRKYEQYLEIRQNIRLRLGLLSCNPQEVVQTMEKPIKLMSEL